MDRRRDAPAARGVCCGALAEPDALGALVPALCTECGTASESEDVDPTAAGRTLSGRRSLSGVQVGVEPDALHLLPGLLRASFEHHDAHAAGGHCPQGLPEKLDVVLDARVRLRVDRTGVTRVHVGERHRCVRQLHRIIGSR